MGAGFRPFYRVIKYSWGVLDTRSKQLLGTIVLFTVTIVTLFVAPSSIFDPINLPKLLILVFFSVIICSLIFPYLARMWRTGFRELLILLSVFILQIILVLLFSGANIVEQIFGTYGRNTGGLAYVALAATMLGSALISSKEYISRFIRMTLIVGVILIIYGNIQYTGHDPLPFENSYTANAPIGTFGNPDFQSAFMGLIAVVAITLAIIKSYKLPARVGLLLIGVAALITVQETIAKQGFFSFVAGSGIVLILWLFKAKKNRLAASLAVFGLFVSVFIFMALLNTGPLANVIYKGSLAARGYYWRAALKMLIDHPIFGVGMDNYLGWYRRARPASYYKDEFFSFSNAAHNVFLDIASNGGFPLLIIYLAITAMVFLSVVRVLKRPNSYDINFVAIVGAWVAYQVQSFISINQIGLAIWGWVTSGLIIGYEINTRTNNSAIVKRVNLQTQRKISSATSNSQLAPSTVLSLFLAAIVGVLIAAPPYYANASFFAAIRSGNIKSMQAAGYLRPLDEHRLLLLATILKDYNYDKESLAVVQDATERYPDAFDFWDLWTKIPTASPSDIAYAKAQMKRLDPFNPDLK